MQPTRQNNPGDISPRASYSGRLNFLRGVFVIIFLAIIARLVFVQGVQGFYYHRIAIDQYESRVTLRADRGMIFDRNGSLIVSNSYGYSYAADPQILDPSEKSSIAGKFSSVLGLPVSYFMSKLNSKSRFVWLARDLTPGQADALHNFSVYGLIKLREQRRIYPYGASAGQVLGYTNVDGKGAGGIELEFDSLLAGTNGYEIMQRDGLGRKMPSVSYPKVDPVSGGNIQLTIDMNIEQIVEQELAAGVKRADAESGTAVFMDPNTGEILAMATCPAFSPANYDDYSYADSRDRAITDVFEPGSTFKIVTASAALEEGIEKPDDLLFAENGKYDLYGRIIRDFESAGWITFRRAVELSSNIVFSKVGEKIGADKFYRYARDFGFGTPTGISLPGEVPGELPKPYDWSKVALPFMSFGYGVMVTTLQMAQAYAAVANGGRLLKPYIVNRITDANGRVLFQNSPMEIRRVVTPNVARTLTGLFVDVVERGTGREARMDNMLIAGKTGTAQKLVDGEYSKKYYHASFAGFFPIPNPQIVGYIMIDAPLNGYTGGQAAAPIFKRIAERIYGIMIRRTTAITNRDDLLAASSEEKQNVPRVVREVSAVSRTAVPVNGVRVPDVSFLDYSSASALLDDFGLQASSSDHGRYVVLSMKPSAGSVVERGSTIQLKVVDARSIRRMPNFRGTSVRNATTFLLAAGIPFHVVGSGTIVSQFPQSGQPINRNVTVTINCQNRSLNVSGLY